MRRLFAVLLVAASPALAQTPISGLPAASSAAGGDIFPATQALDSVTRKITLTQVQLFLEGVINAEDLVSACANGLVLISDGSAWNCSSAAGVIVTDSIDVLGDVDTTTSPPSIGEQLEWDGSNWVPAAAGGGGGGDITDVGDCSTADCFTANGTGNSLIFEGATADGFELNLTAADPGADFTLTLPAETGTVLSSATAAGGDLTGTYPSPTIAANAVALTTDTTGDYVSQVLGSLSITVAGGTGEGTVNTPTWNYVNNPATDPAIVANRVVSGAIGLIFEGATADANELTLTTADPGSDLTVTLPAITGTLVSQAHSIDVLADVDTTTSAPSPGEVLEWDGADWVPATDDAGTGDIDTVGDCTSLNCFTASGVGNQLVFEGSSVDANETTLTAANPGADFTVTIPAETGTIITSATSAAGDLGGTYAAPTVDDDSHNHTTTTVSGLDISDDTNLAVSAPVTLTGDTVGLNQNAGTDVTADLEEEGQINATAVTGNTADDQIIRGTAANTASWTTIPDCNTNNMLTYTQSTNTFGCDADDGAGGGAPVGVQYVVGAADATLTAEKILTDGTGIDTVIAGGDAGSATINLDYTATLAGNPALNADESVFTTDGTGGGILFEGAADTVEGLLVWNPTTADRTITLPDSTGTVVTSATAAGGDLAGTYPNPTVGADAVALATDTTGAYVADITGGAGVTSTGGGAENATVTIALDTSEASSIASGTIAPANNGALVIDTNGDGTNILNDVLQFQSGAEDFLVPVVREYPTVDNSVLAFNATNDDWQWNEAATITAGATGADDQVLVGDGTDYDGEALVNGVLNYATATNSFAAANLADLADVAGSTGTGNVVRTTSPTIVTPTIASLTNAQHDHTNAAGGGSLGASTVGTSQVTDDSLLEADLDAVDAPGDEECLTYESGAGGDFEWQACGGGGGDEVSVDGVAATDPDFRSEGDIDSIRCTGAGAPDASCVAAEDVIFRVQADSVALTTDTTGNYAAGDAEAGAALTGDSATAFFSAGEIEDARVTNALTIAGGTIGTSAITWVQSAAPTPTAEGVCEWETDDDHLICGDSAAQVEFVPAEDVSGDATMDDAGALTIAANSVALTTDTTGNYVLSITNGAGITGGDGGSEGAALTLAATLGTAIDTTEITDDSILEVDLDAVDTPADEECLTFESGAGGDFEWQACGGAEVNDLTAAVTWANVPDANVTGSNERDEVCGTTDLSATCEINADVVNFPDVLYSNTLAGNPALAVDECYFIATATGGGFICEGSAADTSEQLYLFPDVNGADTTNRIAVSATAPITLSAAGDIGSTAATGAVAGHVTTGTQTFGGSKTVTLAAASTGVTAAANDNDTSVSTTEFVQQEINGAGGEHITCTSGSCAVDAELETKDHCITIADPATDDEWYTVWRAPTAVTITEIYCEVTGGTSVAMDFEVDDGTPTGVNGSNITCTTSGVTDSTLAGDTTMADGDRLDVDFGTVTGTVTQASFCVEYTIDD